MRIDVLSIFPEYVTGPAGLSLLGKAQDDGVLDLRCHDLRGWTTDRHRSVDDSPYGGGAGMVMRPDVWVRAAEAVWNDRPALRDDSGAGEPAGSGTGPTADDASVGDVPAADEVPDLPFVAGGDRPRTILFTPRGRPLDQALVVELATEDRLVLCCGRYEGIDERVHDLVATDEVSIGDYVLFGGEVAALVLLEAVVRLLPGVVGNADSPQDESFSHGLLEYPHYTRPLSLRGHDVPDVLRSGDHARIDAWRRSQAEDLTRTRRPDLYE